MRFLVVGAGVIGSALRADGNAEIPTNLRMLYLLPSVFVVGYWRRLLAGPRGELWFGAHCRAAPEEMLSLAQELLVALRRTERSTPDLERLLATPVAEPMGTPAPSPPVDDGL
ncbi:MAG: hypothetical protein H7Y15_09230 [Pseudonocardia sp.]|nr:hypothetical protein [Pseudonocardia sp.]